MLSDPQFYPNCTQAPLKSLNVCNCLKNPGSISPKISCTLYWWYSFICPIFVTSGFQKLNTMLSAISVFAFCLGLLFSEILLFHRRKPSHEVCQICQIKRERTERILTLLSYSSSIILWKVVLSYYLRYGLFHENLNC